MASTWSLVLISILLINESRFTSSKNLERLQEPQQHYRGQVVFLGDSITYFWVQNGAQQWNQFYEPLGAVNTGWPGDWTFDVVNKINGGLIDNLNSRVAVLLIGTNDLGGDGTESSVFTNVGQIINLVKAKNPGVKILLLGILPRNGAAVHQKIRNANALLATYGDNDTVFYLDMEAHFSNDLGSLLPGMSEDGVHLSQLGYTKWTEVMNPLFFAIFDGEQVTTQATTTTTMQTTVTPPTGPTTTTEVSPLGKAIFIGDSITQFWKNDGLATWNQFYESISAINFGVSGDWTDNTISRIVVDGMINGQNADLAVLLIGTNDLSQDTPAQRVADNIQVIITLTKETNPSAKILLLSILPRGDGWDGINHQRVRNVNALIMNYGNQEDVYYLDMEDAFSYDLGFVFPEFYCTDWLHLSSAGYAQWAETMNPIFFQLLGTKQVQTV